MYQRLDHLVFQQRSFSQHPYGHLSLTDTNSVRLKVWQEHRLLGLDILVFKIEGKADRLQFNVYSTLTQLFTAPDED